MAGARASFGNSVASGFVSGIAAALALSAAAFLFQDPVTRYLSQIRPTCDRPEGLVQVDSDEVTATGPLSASQREAAAEPANAVDGYGGSLWIPPSSADESDAHKAVFETGVARLQLNLPSDTELALICVNNGLTSSEQAYRNFGKVRTVRTWTGNDASGATITTLASQATDHMQQLQVVARNMESSSVVTIQVDDAYAGETVETFDPNACGQASEEVQVEGEAPQLRYERGCIVSAAPFAGLSEVVMYEKAEQSWANVIQFWS